MKDPAPHGSFPLNQWWVCARAFEITRAPLARTICGRPIVLFRREDGGVAALDDRCPHRHYPLSRGELMGDVIECGYHGLRFSASGACALIPGADTIPPEMKVRSFPTVEKAGLVYIWPGDAKKADASLLHDFFENEAVGWTSVPDYLHLPVHWQLVIDNLLDLTHTAFAHKSTVGSPQITSNPLVVTVEGDSVRARREIRDVEPSPMFRVLRKFPGRIDRIQNIVFLPPNHVHFQAEVCPAGATNDPDLVHHVLLNHVTPETARSCHYFRSIARRLRIDDPGVSDLLHRMNRTSFAEDAEILRRQQAAIDADPDERPLFELPEDTAVAAARAIVARLAHAEMAPEPLA